MFANSNLLRKLPKVYHRVPETRLCFPHSTGLRLSPPSPCLPSNKLLLPDHSFTLPVSHIQTAAREQGSYQDGGGSHQGNNEWSQTDEDASQQLSAAILPKLEYEKWDDDKRIEVRRARAAARPIGP